MENGTSDDICGLMGKSGLGGKGHYKCRRMDFELGI